MEGKRTVQHQEEAVIPDVSQSVGFHIQVQQVQMVIALNVFIFLLAHIKSDQSPIGDAGVTETYFRNNIWIDPNTRSEVDDCWCSFNAYVFPH